VAKKPTEPQEQTEQQKKLLSQIIQSSTGDKADISLILVGVVAVILGLISTTGLMAKTFLTVSGDFMLVMGIIAIAVGVILRLRKNKNE
jgi:hypothetical protein